VKFGSNLYICFREDKPRCEMFMDRRLALSDAKSSHDDLVI